MFSKDDLTEILCKSYFIDKEFEKPFVKIPKWLELLDKVGEKAITNPPTKKDLKNTKRIPFHEILSLFVDIGFEEFLKKNNYITTYFSQNALQNIQYFLLKRLSKISSETFYVKFCANNIHYLKRFLGQIDLDTNHKNSTTEYDKFINELLSGGLKDFCLEYPVLAKHLSQTVCSWIDFMTELSAIIKKDYVEINRVFFSGNITGKILSIELGLSDNHNDNKTVTLITFENNQRIIFKPRNIGIEKAYYKLLTFLNTKNITCPHRILNLIDGITYGWIEFVEHLPCQNISQISDYYRRAGSLLCIVYIFSGSDFHLENIIANGDTPVLVDLEMLMTNQDLNKTQQLDDLIKKEYSVLYTGLLPVFHINQNGKVSDLSGLGGESSVETTFKEAVWKNINTDSMQVSFEHRYNRSYKNVVKLNENSVQALSFVDEIIRGFKNTYKIFESSKDVLLQKDGLINLFANQPLRYIFRQTQNYSQLLLNVLKPSFLQNGKTHQREIARLLSVLSNQTIPADASIIESECHAIQKLDIPYFSYLPTSKDLMLSPHKKITNYFYKTSFDELANSILNLNPENMHSQITVIKRSYETFNEINRSDSTYITKELSSLKASSFIQKTAKTIIERKLETPNSITWLQIQSLNSAIYTTSIMDSSLYNGTAGIAIFLSAMNKLTPSKDLHNMVHKILRPISNCLCNAHSIVPDKINLGIAAGLGGAIYSLVLAESLLEEDTLYKDTKNIIAKISNRIIEQDKNFDIIGGSAGMILSLLALYQKTTDELALSTAVRCGNHLLKNRSISNIGLRAWKHGQIPAINGQPLCGFSHGASGIAYALLKLYKSTHIKKFLDAAEEAILYEDGIFLVEQNLWPDLRKAYAENPNKQLFNAWCTGATGILLARIEALDLLYKKNMLTDIDRAINIILKTPSNGNTLCCGTYGKIDVLLTAAKKLSRNDLVKEAVKLSSYKCSINSPSKTLLDKDYNWGFFQGISGIAYSMLRLTNIDALPSVLSFDI